MSPWSKTAFALVAAALAFSAVHLEIASGSDLKPIPGLDAGLFSSRGVYLPRSALALESVNRTAKGDRLAAAVPAASGPTIVFTIAGVSNTSVASYLPLAQKSTAVPVAPQAIVKTAACEPPVSMMAEAARVIEVGRCVT